MNSNSRSPRSKSPLTHEQISALAHEIWLERGSPEGSDVDIWLEAERQLRGGAPAAASERDPIPADADQADVDSDPALHPSIDRELEDMGDNGSDRRSPTSFGL